MPNQQLNLDSLFKSEKTEQEQMMKYFSRFAQQFTMRQIKALLRLKHFAGIFKNARMYYEYHEIENLIKFYMQLKYKHDSAKYMHAVGTDLAFRRYFTEQSGHLNIDKK